MADPTRLLRLELRKTDGTVEGPLDAWLIRERIYAGGFDGHEEVRVADGEWRPIATWPEFAPVLALMGVDVEGLQIETRQKEGGLTGWKAAAGTPKPAPRPRQADKPVPDSEAAPGGGIPMWMMVLGGVLLVGAVLFMVLR